MLKFNGLELLEAGTQIITNKRKKHLFDKIIIHFSMQFSAVLNIFIVNT